MKNHIFLFLIPALLIVSQVNSQPADKYLVKAGLLLEAGQYEEALSAINQSMSQQNKNYTRILAGINQGLGNYRQSAELYSKLEENTPGAFQLELARNSALNGDMRKAMDHLNKYFSQKNKLPISKIINDQAFVKFKGKPEWDNMWQQVDYSETERRINQVNSASESGYNEYFRTTLDEALSKYPSNPELLFQQSRYLLDKKMNDAALKAINQSLAQRNSNDQYHYQKAQILLRNNNQKEALVSVNDAISRNPFQARYYLLRIELNRALRNTAAVNEDMQLLNFSLPDNEGVQLAMVQIEADKGNFMNAIDGLNSLIRKNNANKDLYVMRGRLSLKVQKLQNADEDFGMALDLNPADTEANLGKGIAKYRLDEMEAACYYWQKAANEGSREALEYIHKFCGKQK